MASQQTNDLKYIFYIKRYFLVILLYFLHLYKNGLQRLSLQYAAFMDNKELITEIVCVSRFLNQGIWV